MNRRSLLVKVFGGCFAILGIHLFSRKSSAIPAAIDMSDGVEKIFGRIKSKKGKTYYWVPIVPGPNNTWIEASLKEYIIAREFNDRFVDRDWIVQLWQVMPGDWRFFSPSKFVADVCGNDSDY